VWLKVYVSVAHENKLDNIGIRNERFERIGCVVHAGELASVLRTSGRGPEGPESKREAR
jgi:hypothetical protein